MADKLFKDYFNERTEQNAVGISSKILTQDAAGNVQKIDVNKFTAAGGYTGTAQTLKDEIDSINFDGAKIYETLADAKAVTPTPADYTGFKVSDSDINNAGNWYYLSSELDGVKFSHPFGMEKDVYLDFIVGKNQFNPLTDIVYDSYLNNSGVITSAAGTARSKFYPVEEGDIWTLSGQRGRIGVSLFENETDTTPVRYVPFPTLPLQLTMAANENFYCFNLYLSGNPTYSDIMLEKGTLSTYEPYTLTQKIKEDYLPAQTTIPFTVSLNSDTQAETYIENIIDSKVLRQELYIFDDTKVFNNGDLYYDGVKLGSFNDEAAPYRIDGGTLGANHNGTADNQNYKKRIFVDDIEIFDFKRVYYPSESFSVHEQYEILGEDTSGEIATVSILNKYDSKGTLTIKSDIYALQTVDLDDIMFTQSKALLDTYNLYIPKSIPFTQSSINYDFAQIESIDTNVATTDINFFTNRCESDGILVDRAVQLKSGLGMAIGYLPIQDAEIARRRTLATEKALEVRGDTKKIYMSAIDPIGTGTFNAGDYYSVVAYKSFFATSTDETCNYYIDNNDSIYVYLDWHTSGLKRSDLPSSTAGRGFEVIEKSSGVDIKSSVSTGSILADVTLTNGYAYLILKF